MKIFYLLTFTLLFAFTAISQPAPNAGADRNATARNIIKFYPNPATSLINFDFQQDYNKSYTFQIFSFVGKKVYDLQNVSPKTVVNLTDFYRGIYIFQLRDRNGKVIDSGKFQVSK